MKKSSPKQVKWNAPSLIHNWAGSWTIATSIMQLYRKGLITHETIPTLSADAERAPPPLSTEQNIKEKTNQLS